MNEHPDNQTLARQYLLGVMSEDEVARFEERYFSDNGLYEEIEIAEDELIDAYLRGHLSEEDRQRFEKGLATSRRLSERVQFSKLLIARAADRPVPVSTSDTQISWWSALFTTPALKAAVTVGVVILVVGIPAVTIQWWQLRNESQRVAAERAELEKRQKDLEQQIADLRVNSNQLSAEVQQEKAAKEKLNQELQLLKEQRAQQSPQLGVTQIASAVLFSGFSRGQTDDTGLIVQPQQTVIKLELVLDFDQYSTYDVSIESADGRELVSRKNRRPGGPASQRSIVVQFSSRSLPEGTYVVKVSGRTSSGNYESVPGYRFRLSQK